MPKLKCFDGQRKTDANYYGMHPSIMSTLLISKTKIILITIKIQIITITV